MKNNKFLLKLAREAIETFVKEKKILHIEKYPEELKERRGVFVTIYKHVPIDGVASMKNLRGCIGLPHPEKSLIEGVINAAISSCKDPRFEPLREEELNSISIELSVLSDPKELKIKNRKALPKILDSNYGYIIKKGLNSGLFLPQVWKELPKKEEFLSNLCLKAGLDPEAWKHDESLKIYKFEAQILKEKTLIQGNI